jgi:hypothetical protein
MPRKSPFSVALTEEERQHLDSLARQYTSPYCDVIRAKIILLALVPLELTVRVLPSAESLPVWC